MGLRGLRGVWGAAPLATLAVNQCEYQICTKYQNQLPKWVWDRLAIAIHWRVLSLRAALCQLLLQPHTSSGYVTDTRCWDDGYDGYSDGEADKDWLANSGFPVSRSRTYTKCLSYLLFLAGIITKIPGHISTARFRIRRWVFRRYEKSEIRRIR